MLKIRQLSVAVEDKEIIHDVNLTIHRGETHVLFGPNGAGKSTLLMAIMGFPKYQITKGSITFKGKDITGLTVDERARLGIGVSFQRPPVVRGVKTQDMVAACLKGRGDGETINKLAEKADLSELSGVDLVNIALIGELMNDLLEKNCPIQYRRCMGLIITHTGHILDYVNARTGYVMCDGTIGCTGDPHEILATIRERGYTECIKCYLGRVLPHE